ncbi:MAG TPA: hypothetical protein VF698_09645 [Thermoanaerobaculia bacterium]
MTMYSLTFRNHTSRTWTACIYQELSESRTFETLAWLTATASPGTESRLLWTSTLSIVLGEFGSGLNRSLYLPREYVDTEPGTTWRITAPEGRQRFERIGSAALPDQICITNESRRVASPGVAVHGSPVCFAPGLLSGSTAQFLVRPTHYVGLFRDIRAGEIIRRPVVRALLKFGPHVMPAGTLDLREEGSNLVVDLRPGGIEYVPLASL